MSLSKDIDIEKEYELIKAKKSRLTPKQRDEVIYYYHKNKSKYHEH